MPTYVNDKRAATAEAGGGRTTTSKQKRIFISAFFPVFASHLRMPHKKSLELEKRTETGITRTIRRRKSEIQKDLNSLKAL